MKHVFGLKIKELVKICRIKFRYDETPYKYDIKKARSLTKARCRRMNLTQVGERYASSEVLTLTGIVWGTVKKNPGAWVPTLGSLI